MSQPELEREALNLSTQGRAELAHKLLSSLKNLSESELEGQSLDRDLTPNSTSSGEIVEKNGLYVWTGDVPLEESWEEMTDNLREGRVDAILGIG